MKRIHLMGAGLLAALALAGCAGMQPRPNSLAPGTTWVNAVTNTGSYGKQNGELRTTRVGGERMWQGRKVFVYEQTPGVNILTDPDTGHWIAILRGDTLLQSFEPAIGWDRPLEVGKTWSRKHRSTNHVKKTTTDFVGTWKVEAYEDVTVRAGTFKAYKVLYSDTLGTEGATWWSPEIDAWVKVSNRRSAKNPAGAGTSDTELVKRPAAP